MNEFLVQVKATVRSLMHHVAKALNRVSRGRLKPNTVTVVGLLAHIPIAWAIATHRNLLAAGLLVFFGLFDALDGELARLQKRVSASGGLLDTVTDRMKEILLYIGVAYALVSSGHSYAAVWAVAACGSSILVPFVKAKGETIVAGAHLSYAEVNRLFQGGLMSFEVRMTALILGLLLNQLTLVVAFIALLGLYTALQRLNMITDKINKFEAPSSPGLRGQK